MKTDIEQIQNKSLSILVELLNIFEEHNLTYFLSGGTFLGAVRHKGFIPWDDDIDISMPRESYEKFLSVTEQLPKNLFIRNFRIDATYRYFITRVLDKTMDVMDVRTKEITHPAVDILPLDGAPNNIILRKLYFFEIMSIRALSSMSNRDIIDHSRKRNVFEKVLISIVMKIPFEKILNDRKLKYYLEKRMKSYSVKESRYIGCLMGAYRTKQMVPKDWFGNGEGYVFEDLLVNGPVDYSNYLKQMYGDYMKMPDDETIKSKIHYKIVEKMKNKIGFTAGTFDMFHIGHLNLLKEAKKNCQYLIVGVNKDNLVSTYKKKLPLIPEDERAEIINALAYVDEVYLMDTLDKMEAFKRFHFDVIFIGSDWQGSERYKMEEKRMEDVGVAITYIPYTSEISSTMLAHRILENELTRTSFQRKIKELNK